MKNGCAQSVMKVLLLSLKITKLLAWRDAGLDYRCCPFHLFSKFTISCAVFTGKTTVMRSSLHICQSHVLSPFLMSTSQDCEMTDLMISYYLES